jgi:hypothetical protein
VALADAAAATESSTQAVSTAGVDAAGSQDSVAVSATVLTPDRAGAAEAWATAANLATADAAAGADALTTTQAGQPVLADAAGGTEAYSAAVATSRGDVAAASEQLSVALTIQLADRAGAADALVYSIPPTQPQPFWAAAPAALRWHVTDVPARWQVAGAGARWETRPSPPRWAARGMTARWVILVAEFEPIASVSQEMVNVSWTSDLGGSDVDPTTGPMPVQFAFPASSGDELHPAAPVTWFTGTWLPDTGSYKGYIAQCSVGPTGLGGLVQLTPGKYDVWSWVQAGTENPRKFAGQLAVY